MMIVYAAIIKKRGRLGNGQRVTLAGGGVVPVCQSVYTSGHAGLTGNQRGGPTSAGQRIHYLSGETIVKYRFVPVITLVITLAVVWPPIIQAQDVSARDAAWREDLATLAAELPQRHVAPFAKVSQADFEAAVTDPVPD
jgi:hypothetical protein